MTSCPSSSHTTNYPDVEVPNAVSSPQMRSTFPSHHNSESSGTQDFSHQRRPEENSSQNNVLSTFSNQNLSTNRHGEKPIENSVFQSKLSNQSRRVGLRKPGRSTFGGFLPGSTITTQTPSPASRSDSSSLIDSNAKFKVGVQYGILTSRRRGQIGGGNKQGFKGLSRIFSGRDA